MKILFIHSFDYYEPLGIMTISAFLKQNNYECELFDLKLEKRDYIPKIKNIKPDIIAYSITTNNWKKYHAINLRLKSELNFFAVFGGPHATFFPEFIMEDGVDAICRGEGELAMLDLVNAIKNNHDIHKIQNLWVKLNERVYKNDLRCLISNLDELPFPDRELINKYKHYSKRSRIRAISSRGCPFYCTYCFNHSMKKIYQGKGKYVRQRSPHNLICELKNLKKMYKPRNFEFHDDIFILDKKWLEEFVNLYIEEKINIPFEINVRIDMINEDIVYLLKKAGCYSMQFGIETGNENLRKELLKRDIKNSTIINSSQIINRYNIKINTFNLIGIPTETVNNVIETIRLNNACKVTYAMNSIYQPYPTTWLSDFAKSRNLYDGNLSSFDKNYLYGKSIIKSPEKNEIERLHYLFAFGVKAPFLIPAIIILIKLPLIKLYQSWYFFYRAFSVIFVFKRLSFKEIFIRE